MPVIKSHEHLPTHEQLIFIRLKWAIYDKLVWLEKINESDLKQSVLVLFNLICLFNLFLTSSFFSLCCAAFFPFLLLFVFSHTTVMFFYFTIISLSCVLFALSHFHILKFSQFYLFTVSCLSAFLLLTVCLSQEFSINRPCFYDYKPSSHVSVMSFGQWPGPAENIQLNMALIFWLLEVRLIYPSWNLNSLWSGYLTCKIR